MSSLTFSAEWRRLYEAVGALVAHWHDPLAGGRDGEADVEEWEIIHDGLETELERVYRALEARERDKNVTAERTGGHWP